MSRLDRFKMPFEVISVARSFRHYPGIACFQENRLPSDFEFCFAFEHVAHRFVAARGERLLLVRILVPEPHRNTFSGCQIDESLCSGGRVRRINFDDGGITHVE